MERRKEILANVGLLLLRLSFGGTMLAAHGAKKLMTGVAADFSDPLGVGSVPSYWLAIFAEVGCALLVVLGLATRAATVPLLVTMAVAAGIVHAGDPFGRKELALVYAAAYLVLLLTGPGDYSLDALILRRRKAAA